jgi:acyl-CoA dehydrogenase
MIFNLTDEQRAIAEAVDALCSKFPDDYWMEKDQTETFPWEFYRAFADAGYLGLIIPEAYGGAGLGLAEACVALQRVAMSGAAHTGVTTVHISIFGMTPVVKFGSEEMRRKYLPPLCKGDLHVCFGVTEPDAGTDTTQIKTFARREGDHYVVSGKKVWTSKAEESSKCLLLVRTTPIEQCKKKSDGMTLLLADLDPSAVTIRPIPKMGRKAVGSCEVFYDNLKVHVSDRVGEEGRGFHYLLDGLNAERIVVAFETIGVGRAALKKAANYAKERVVFGRPIGQNQGVQFPLADSLAKLEAAELMAWKAVWQYDQGLPCGDFANMAKYLAAEASFEACDRAVQTHGGYGYAAEFHVERYFRETRLWRITPLAQNFILAYIAEKILGLPRSY